MRTLVTESSLEFKDVDVNEMAKFLAIEYTREELVSRKVISCIPKRQVECDGTSRRPPTLAYLDSNHYTRVRNGRKEKDIPKWNWEGVKTPSKAQKTRMVAMTLVAVAKYVFENHLYKFKGQVYCQKTGGPIGDNSTCDAASIVMWIFTLGYKKALANLGILQHTILLKIYVDDLNQVGLRLPYGSIFRKGKL